MRIAGDTKIVFQPGVLRLRFVGLPLRRDLKNLLHRQTLDEQIWNRYRTKKHREISKVCVLERKMRERRDAPGQPLMKINWLQELQLSAANRNPARQRVYRNSVSLSAIWKLKFKSVSKSRDKLYKLSGRGGGWRSYLVFAERAAAHKTHGNWQQAGRQSASHATHDVGVGDGRDATSTSTVAFSAVQTGRETIGWQLVCVWLAVVSVCVCASRI